MVDTEFLVMTANIAVVCVIFFLVGWYLAREKMKRAILSQAGQLMVNIELTRFIEYAIPLKFDFSTQFDIIDKMKEREKKRKRDWGFQP